MATKLAMMKHKKQYQVQHLLLREQRGAAVPEEGDGNNAVGDNNTDSVIAQNGRSFLLQNNNKQRKSTLNKKMFPSISSI
eukprot:3780437-Ditylum_brightwellii.AAC.1